MSPKSRALLKNPLIVALDVDLEKEAVEIAESLAGRAGGFKLGPRLLIRSGEKLIQEVAKHAPVFVDCKYLDIPSTMESAVRASFEAGATLVTVHAWAGAEALIRLAELEAQLCQRRPFKILAVTILTSFSEETLPPTLAGRAIADQVDELAKLTLDSGLSGLVSSAQEAERLKLRFPECYLVTPGIRMPEAEKSDDQKRVLGPAEALAAGADALVVGRPIVDADDVVAAADIFLSAIAR